MPKLTNDILVTTDKHGLVLTTDRQVLHVTVRNGIPHVWFVQTEPEAWKGCGPTTTIHGLTPDGGFFNGRFSKGETTDQVLEQYTKEWENDIFQLGGLSFREHSELWLEHLEKTEPEAIPIWINNMLPFAQDEYDDLQKSHAAQRQREEFFRTHSVDSQWMLNGRYFIITEVDSYRGFTLAPVLSDGSKGKRVQVWYYQDLVKALQGGAE